MVFAKTKFNANLGEFFQRPELSVKNDFSMAKKTTETGLARLAMLTFGLNFSDS